jgi:H/ACA ribonucleoprotein complex subunit 4
MMLPQEVKNRKRLIKSSQMTTSKFGKIPTNRTLDELLQSGLILLDKPSGPTSHQVAAWVKEILGVAKAGHGGTLDPKVTGLLPITLGRATNAVRSLLLGGKEYVGAMKLHADVPKKDIERIFKEFTGKIYQMPPVRSAVKRQLRIREIYYLEPLEKEKRLVLFKVGSEAGTYIRTLCHDIGDALGCGAHMAELRRTKIALFTENEAVTLHDLKDAFVFWKENDNEEELRKMILPYERILNHFPKIVVKDTAVDAICHGANLAIPGILEVDSDIGKNDLVGIMTAKGEAIALGKSHKTSGEIINETQGIAAKTERVFMDPGTYPKMWHGT